ncbi:Hsp20/alpha crystallin family protein [Metapseudomonas lalkuanensis]|uniref:Hsp20/alpha crystallin family protein n=1 Tax=Metapseudomonas lalkuanensis TaxID=2604832 RepID=A0A5J6QMM3_9GAMM|nr:Hsp20/alpha crystallin family protein [Pseudomonas lalkuanensis]QEY63754.1 Hsp20/alpha crystallin family protein [Pseudomonas lalkuanensis]
MDKLVELKHGLEETWHSLGEGWRQLRDRASEALTRFTPVNRSRSSSEEPSLPPALASNWGLLAGDLYENGEQIVIRLEVPGMVKDDLDLEVHGDALIIRGEKRIEQEQGNGRYRVRQCTFGSFRRSFQLPAPVIAEKARARCSNGVLRVELPKEERVRGRRIEVRSG